MGGDRFAAFLLSMVVAVGVVALPAAPAAAATRAAVNSPALPLKVRTGPARWHPQVAVLHHGSPVTPVCQVEGQSARGTERSTRMWNRLPDGSYVSDSYVRRSGQPPRCAATLPGAVPVAGGSGASRAPAGPAVPKAAARLGWAHPLPGFRVQGGFRTGLRPLHRGVDIMSFRGTPVRAPAPGTVLEVVCDIQPGASCDVPGNPSVRGCGWYIKIEHPGRVATLYCHLLRRPDLQPGQRVSAGQVIGLVGMSGRTSFPHLHYEVHLTAPPTSDLTAVDPLWFMARVGSPLPAGR